MDGARKPVRQDVAKPVAKLLLLVEPALLREVPAVSLVPEYIESMFSRLDSFRELLVLFAQV